jgi:hypothetical protein
LASVERLAPPCFSLLSGRKLLRQAMVITKTL